MQFLSRYFLWIFIAGGLIFGFFYLQQPQSNIPIVAIANYGPHASLESIIHGLKEGMVDEGFVEGKTVHYEEMDISFQPSLIAQMLSKLMQYKPAVMVTMTTPVAQLAKTSIKDTPLIYAAVTDPIEAGLIKDRLHADGLMTGVSDQQNLEAVLAFAQKLMPEAKRVGLLYATSEVNDKALLNGLQAAAEKWNMEVVAIGVDQVRDVALRMPLFRDRVDFIYVGTSGPIQPSLPTIAAEADKMHIPIINANDQAVKDGWVLASFGVDYEAIGKKVGHLVAAIIRGASVSTLTPIYPFLEEHRATLNQKRLLELGFKAPEGSHIVD